ncbi:MAG: hypothetical protein LBO62_05730 [Endomicrobium sp.]|nr:hypothetical protein [Endomicrobium sp.]
MIKDFYLNNETQADMIEGYANVSALEKKLSQKSGIKIIRDTEITNLYKNFRKDSLMEKSV